MTDQHPDPGSLRAEAQACLTVLTGSPAARLRDDQWTAISALVDDRVRALVVQRTGWGKSAVYFVATALLRARGSGPSVIVSPLLALMRNQIAAAERAGIRARTVNSVNVEQWDEVYAEIAAGQVDVLLVSPERINNPGFRDLVLPKLIASAGMLVVDEAHCISDWGHDFRPDYRRLRTLLAELPPGVPVLATTATANERVTRDVAEQLGAGYDGETLVLRGSLDRASLRLAVVRLPTAHQRLGWLADHLAELPGSGIIYALTVAAAREAASFLRDEGQHVASYTGQDDPAGRQAAEDALLAGDLKALVATSALGMGFDKPDLGFVAHLGAPQSPIAYYQQIGRAGRAVDRAEVILLPGREDADIWAYFGSLAFPPEPLVRRTLSVLEQAGRPLSTAAVESSVDLSRNRLDTMLKVLDVDGAVLRVGGGWIVTGQPWVYDAERYARVAAERAREQQAMLGYIATDECRMEYLRAQLDDPGAAPCGRCDNCTGEPWPATVRPTSAGAARDHLSRPGIEIAPRKMWPTNMRELGVDIAGKIAADLSAEPGRALGRLTDLGWGPRLRALFAGPGPSGPAPSGPAGPSRPVPDGAMPDGPMPAGPVPDDGVRAGEDTGQGPATDQPVPDDMVAAVVKVLAAWDWAVRPGAVVAMCSRTRPQLVQDLASQIAAIGRMRYLGSLEPGGQAGAGQRQHNSAQRLRAVWDGVLVPDQMRADLAGLDAPVLLVDDRIETGWTMTVAAMRLREAGAAAVLPLVLATAAT